MPLEGRGVDRACHAAWPFKVGPSCVATALRALGLAMVVRSSTAGLTGQELAGTGFSRAAAEAGARRKHGCFDLTTGGLRLTKAANDPIGKRLCKRWRGTPTCRQFGER